MLLSGVVGVGVAVAAWLIFAVVVASSFVIYAVLLYAAIVTGIVGIGLGAAGAVHFGKDVEPVKPAASSVSAGGGAGEYSYRSTATSSYRSRDD